MRAISEEIHTNFIHNKCSRFIAKLFPHLPGANELRSPRVMEVSRIPCDTCATVQRWRGIPHGGNDGYENTQQHSWSFHKIFIPGFNLISIVQQQQKQRQQQQQKLCYRSWHLRMLSLGKGGTSKCCILQFLHVGTQIWGEWCVWEFMEFFLPHCLIMWLRLFNI